MILHHDCPACAEEGSVSAEDDLDKTCACEDCGATFEIDPDYDWTGDGYRDCSSVGKHLTGDRLLDAPNGIRVCMDAATNSADWARRMELVLDHLGLSPTLQAPLLEAWKKVTMGSAAPAVDRLMQRLEGVSS